MHAPLILAGPAAAQPAVVPAVRLPGDVSPGLTPDGSVQDLLANDPWWLSLIKAVVIFAALLLLTLFAIWFERRVVGRMQHRPGPNWNGPFGLLQSLADAIKLIFKEGIIPARADKVVFIAAPIMAAIPAFLTFSIIPLGGPVSMFGHHTALQLTDLSVGVLAALAFASIGVYGIVLGGWASGSTYPLLGGLRSAAQLISYEVAMGLSFVAVFLYSGTLSTSAIVQQQTGGWYIWLLPVSFVVYVVSMVGETNRAPFDMAEAEGELVGGFNTEYSGMRFGTFFLAEYINMINVSAIATTLFLGGWRAPWPLSRIPGLNSGWVTLVWFLVKVLLFLFFFVWIRGSLPRIRYDQFMHMGWKVLVPVSLVWIVLIGTARVLNTATDLSTRQVLLYMGIPLVVLLVLAAVWPQRRRTGPDGERPDDVAAGPATDGPSGGSGVVAPRLGAFPVPPLDLVVPVSPRRAALPPAPADPAAPAQQPQAVPAGTGSQGGRDVVS
ncbi:NADH-quinone oxidoreductase subunit NuoH [Nakamurella endophytica]|uniref:NADH-quinone oxidoreductase subunit H n=1 Tax=Nakamurella endophytica TaxID=1748367 RepID=A0A917SZS7_9ACTN|nr:NADH-quinone oxidoreductase subunit NuoH [Nakamurella endophytica]GGM03743.1 NADH-quinone oxidoreductase subunit H [Nakamurella endophytica]